MLTDLEIAQQAKILKIKEIAKTVFVYTIDHVYDENEYEVLSNYTFISLVKLESLTTAELIAKAQFIIFPSKYFTNGDGEECVMYNLIPDSNKEHLEINGYNYDLEGAINVTLADIE